MKLRRRALLVAAAAAALSARAARAQSPARYAVLSLLADKFEVVGAQPEIGSRVDSNRRQAFEDPKGSFDGYAVAAVERAIKGIDSAAVVTLLAMPRTSVLYEQPQRIFDGRIVALPGAVVDALEAAKAGRLVLITKHRAETRVPLVDGHIGNGTVRGLGFYLDTSVKVRSTKNNALSDGLLAPFVYLRLSLIDVTSGEIVRERLIQAMTAITPSGKPESLNPWDLLGPEEKVRVLRGLLERELAREVPALLQR